MNCKICDQPAFQLVYDRRKEVFEKKQFKPAPDAVSFTCHSCIFRSSDNPKREKPKLRIPL